MSDTSGKDRSWLEIAGAFLKLGAISYGGAALMGLLQRELQEKRGWVSKEQFVEVLGVVMFHPARVPDPAPTSTRQIRTKSIGGISSWH